MKLLSMSTACLASLIALALGSPVPTLSSRAFPNDIVTSSTPWTWTDMDNIPIKNATIAEGYFFNGVVQFPNKEAYVIKAVDAPLSQQTLTDRARVIDIESIEIRAYLFYGVFKMGYIRIEDDNPILERKQYRVASQEYLEWLTLSGCNKHDACKRGIPEAAQITEVKSTLDEIAEVTGLPDVESIEQANFAPMALNNVSIRDVSFQGIFVKGLATINGKDILIRNWYENPPKEATPETIKDINNGMIKQALFLNGNFRMGTLVIEPHNPVLISADEYYLPLRSGNNPLEQVMKSLAPDLGSATAQLPNGESIQIRDIDITPPKITPATANFNFARLHIHNVTFENAWFPGGVFVEGFATINGKSIKVDRLGKAPIPEGAFDGTIQDFTAPLIQNTLFVNGKFMMGTVFMGRKDVEPFQIASHDYHLQLVNSTPVQAEADHNNHHRPSHPKRESGDGEENAPVQAEVFPCGTDCTHHLLSHPKTESNEEDAPVRAKILPRGHDNHHRPSHPKRSSNEETTPVQIDNFPTGDDTMHLWPPKIQVWHPHSPPCHRPEDNPTECLPIENPADHVSHEKPAESNPSPSGEDDKGDAAQLVTPRDQVEIAREYTAHFMGERKGVTAQ